MTITEFLLARIEEDEAAAREIAECESHDPEGQGYVGTVMEMIGHKRHGVITVDPARILAECAAKRSIIAEYDGLTFEQRKTFDAWEPYRSVMRNVLVQMAAVYKDHPDYRQEWAL